MQMQPQERARTFAPGDNDIFWCQSCNVPLLSEKCSVCGSTGSRISLSPPADVRLCSTKGRELLKGLFDQSFGCSEFLDDRVILLNKIAGIDRRDQVFVDGRHIATLWFDIISGEYRLDLELAGAVFLSPVAQKNIVVCDTALLRGHIKGKWLAKDLIASQSNELSEGDYAILKVGKFVGVGVARKRQDGTLSIRIREVTQEGLRLRDRAASIDDVIRANEDHLKRIEKAAIKELNEAISRTRLPVNVSFSGGKDSLASLGLCMKFRPKADVLFINTQLEFPETLDYVQELCKSRKLKLHVIGHEITGDNKCDGGFFSQVRKFGPPAKDYRWCCKTNKLGPLNSFIQSHYPKGCVTIEGRRIYESFSRSKIGAVERNPYVPNQTTLSPIRNWKALEVMLYIYWNRMVPNPLYDCDYERIGCWLCPASLQSEFANLKEHHPEMYNQWTTFLRDWAAENGLDQRYVDLGFWRWKSHPPKILEIAKAEGISLRMKDAEKKEFGLEMVRGRSPCGVSYSIDANLTAPQNHPFSSVANVLNTVGDVKYSESLGAATVKTKDGKCNVFASGHLFVTAPEEKADQILKDVVGAVLRVQICTRCKICEKSCPKGAIKVEETIQVDEARCTHCGKCARGCIAADQAAKAFLDMRDTEEATGSPEKQKA